MNEQGQVPPRERIKELEEALKSIAARARFEQTHPTELHMTCLSLIEREAISALAGIGTYDYELLPRDDQQSDRTSASTCSPSA